MHTCTAMVQSCRAFRGRARDRWQAALLVSSFTKTWPLCMPPSCSTFRPCMCAIATDPLVPEGVGGGGGGGAGRGGKVGGRRQVERDYREIERD